MRNLRASDARPVAIGEITSRFPGNWNVYRPATRKSLIWLMDGGASSGRLPQSEFG